MTKKKKKKKGMKKKGVFFIDGPAGTGKTFLYSVILNMVRSERNIALAVASSGIAALLLKGGRTAHSRFKIPITIGPTSTCSITPRSNLGKLIKKAKVIVWDEAPMTHRHAFEALDRTLKDVMKSVDPTLGDEPFGGKVVVFGGDFRQTPPVISKGSRSVIVEACLKRSYLWQKTRTLKLTINMRLCNPEDPGFDHQLSDYATLLLMIGDGVIGIPQSDGSAIVELPPDIVLPPGASISMLINSVYPDLLANIGSSRYMMERGILCPKNSDVAEVNDEVMGMIPGNTKEYLSADTIVGEGNDNIGATFPIEFINSFNSSGFPPHRLSLKIGTPIMLLRNLRPQDGLCNGTRLICKEFLPHVIKAEIITGTHSGTEVFLPRIPFISSESDLPVIIRRLQFPVRPAFAMTINKSQGQTMRYVGVYLPNPVFTHGQLYVALSRSTSRKNMFILNGKGDTDKAGGPRNSTSNIVYSEILDESGDIEMEEAEDADHDGNIAD